MGPGEAHTQRRDHLNTQPIHVEPIENTVRPLTMCYIDMELHLTPINKDTGTVGQLESNGDMSLRC